MLRKTRIILLILAAALAVANSAVFIHSRATGQSAASAKHANWHQWRALTRSEQLEYVHLFQGLAQRAEAGAILSSARKFAAHSSRRQQSLRELQRVQQEVLEQLPPPRRRDLRRATPEHRAFFIFQELLSKDPRRLAELAARLEEAS